MSLNKYENIKIPIFKKAQYPPWKVWTLMHLEATHPDYLDIINDGPPVPTKLVPLNPIVPDHYQVKERKEWFAEEKAVVLKYAKVRNILHNNLDSVMSNRVIACTIVKDIFDSLEI